MGHPSSIRSSSPRKTDTTTHQASPTLFFQAEDGMRNGRVTGVQTCALPISGSRPAGDDMAGRRREGTQRERRAERSEERRVGKEGIARRRAPDSKEE